MIEIKHVTKTFGSKTAVDHIDLNIPAGEIVGFIGPNGAGKTTTIKMMSGVLEPDEGDILIDGKSIRSEPLEAKKRFGLVPDSPDMFLRLKGIEYLNFMGDIYEVESSLREQRIASLADTFEMRDALNDKILSYSHGMRQKIVLMGALMPWQDRLFRHAGRSARRPWRPEPGRALPRGDLSCISCSPSSASS